MDSFVVFIRSLNVGKKNIVDIDELIKIFNADGLVRVRSFGVKGTFIVDSDIEKEEVKMLVEDILIEEFNITTICRVIELEELRKNISLDLFPEYIGERVFVSLVDNRFEFPVGYLNEKEDITILEVIDEIVITCVLMTSGKTPDVNYFLEDLSKSGVVTRDINTIKRILGE